MGLRQTISEWVTAIKDALDFGPEFPDAMEARRVLFAQEAARLQHLLEQTRKASQEKDQLIAKLQAVGAVAGSMVVDGPAYYIRRANTLEGPFCTACFQRNHEIMRITPAPKWKGNDRTPTDWVQCARCRAAFRSDRISQFLNPVRVPADGLAPAGALPKRDESRLASPASQETGPDDKRQGKEAAEQTTADGKQKVEPQSPPSSVLRQPPSDQQRESKPLQPQDPALEGAIATRKDALRTPCPSPDALPRVEAPKPAAAPTAVPAQQSDTPKPVKTARKPRKGPERGTSRVGKAPTGETGPAEETPPAQGIAMASPAPTADTAVEAPRPSRTRSRTRKSKGRRAQKTMLTDRSTSTR
jgi:hypothetical protein